MKKFTILISGILIVLSSCTVTNPKLQYSGGNYNSISDDIILTDASNEAVKKLTKEIDRSEKVLLVQVVDSRQSDLLADKIYEQLSVKGLIVGRTTNDDLKEMNTDMFDKFLMFYPEVYGTQTAQTKPTAITKGAAFALNLVPVAGQFLSRSLLKNYNYQDRHAGVSIHCRLVDRKSGKIEWINNFTGQNKIRLKGGLKKSLGLPQ
jgi:hypothetical protein